MKFQAHDNWLAEIGKSDTSLHYIDNLDGLTVKKVQEAFDNYYGKGEFDVTRHGNIIAVFSCRGYIQEQLSKGEAESSINARLQIRAIMG